MKTVELLFGSGKELTALQMCDRGIVIFLIALLLIRISGRRSFGLHTPLDSIITILLGAILSRAVTGSSPFVPVVAACLVIVIIHRSLSWLLVRSPRLRKVTDGEAIVLYDQGVFLEDNMRRALISKDDIMQGIRTTALTEDLSRIKRVYMETNGKVSIVKNE